MVEFETGCTKIAHHHSLVFFTVSSGKARIPAVGSVFACLNRRGNRRSLAIFDRKEIASWGLKNREFAGSGINRRRNRRESGDFGALTLDIASELFQHGPCPVIFDGGTNHHALPVGSPETCAH